MIKIITSYWFYLAVFILLLCSSFIGRRIGKWKISRQKENELGIIGVAEGAVFALLGLLIAFTFSGAYDRFQTRKIHIIDEANAYQTAYLGINLLTTRTQADLRDTFKHYLDSRLLVYKLVAIGGPSLSDQLKNSDNIKRMLWSQVIAATEATHNDTVTSLVIPGVYAMFDAADGGYQMTRVHPPLVIFCLLLALATLGSFLSGYSTAEKKADTNLYIFSYVLITSVTIFLIINLEYPRMGKIKVSDFDKVLIEVRNKWN